MTTTSKKTLLLIYTVMCLLVVSTTYLGFLNSKPQGIHQWAQADRLALCLRYIEGKELTDPATYSTKTINGNVGVEFSGFQFVLAKIVQIGYPIDYLPLLYRGITFLCLFSSLFLLTFFILNSENLVFKVMTFIGIFSSPILVYYSFNFTPDILALSLILISFYFFQKNFSRYIYIILMLSGLSLLIKASSGIYFISFVSIFFLQHWRSWNLRLTMVIFISILIGLGVFYYDYNYVHLRNKEYYSYVFLSSSVPVSNWNEFRHVIEIASRFMNEYLNRSQQILLGVITLISLFRFKYFSIRNKYCQLGVLISLGLISLIILFGVQYMNHDYYFLATFMPIIILFALTSLKRIAPYVHPNMALVLVSLFAISSYSYGNKRYFNRMSETVWIDNSPESYDYKWLNNVEQKIESIVKDDELIFSVYTPEPNFTLVHLERRGATFNTEELQREESPFIYYLEKLKPGFVICKSDDITQFQSDQPNFLKSCTIAYKDSSFTLYRINHGY